MAALAVGLCLLGIAAPASPAAEENRGRARDCTTEAMLDRGSQNAIRYVVWCGVQKGRVTLRIKRKQGALSGFSPIAAASGPGAAGPMRCRPLRGGRAFCSARKRGPVTFRGTVAVPRGTRCATLLSLNVWRWTGDSVDFPSGCPRSYEARERHLGQILSDRAWYGLDRDLLGDHAARVRRAEGLLAAWRRGEPVARWTSEEEAFGMPLRAAEQTELEYRDTYREHFQDMVEDGDWVKRNAPDSWAGYELDEAAGGIIWVGFTKEPEALLEKLRRSLIAPERFRLFPVQPRYTEAQLEKIWFSFPRPKSPLWHLINSTSIDYLANKIEVSTEHVDRVKRLIAEEYGPEAPFEVVFGRPAILLAASNPS
ncbi:MAG TPA: hypothetical protein VEP91_08230 [Solirubrobacterales bacterium]|nr:hypothetical protein [Solirubrobacterales bacterium]